MIDLTPKNCEKGLIVKLKDGHWASLSNGKKVQTDLLEPKFLERWKTSKKKKRKTKRNIT